MSKKIIFLMTFLVLSISNNTQTMFFSLLLSGCVSDDEKNDENCCSSCLRISTVLLAAIFARQSNQAADFEHNRSNSLDYLANSHFSMSKFQTKLESKKMT